jgi:hypothetical protein
VEAKAKSNMSREELFKWQSELYELEKTVVSGKNMTQEQMDKNVRELLDPNYKSYLLDKAKAHKEELLNTLKWVERRIEGLTNEIEEEEKSKVENLS